MPNALALRSSQDLTVSELINVHIPRTCDQGDALAAAVAITKAAYKACIADDTLAFNYKVFANSIHMKLVDQHIAWMKGE